MRRSEREKRKPKPKAANIFTLQRALYVYGTAYECGFGRLGCECVGAPFVV